MATEFAMPAPSMAPIGQYTASPTQYNLFTFQSQPISPINSTNPTPHNASPTSPRAALAIAPQPRQLRPLKSPLYVPAVLRPTEPPKRPTKPAPLTPPHSAHGSFDSLNHIAPLTRRSAIDSGKFGLGKISESRWSMSMLGKVTNLPTRSHWKVCW